MKLSTPNVVLPIIQRVEELGVGCWELGDEEAGGRGDGGTWGLGDLGTWKLCGELGMSKT